MTFVGKLLVVVQLFLSVCFMAFAGAVFSVQTNWKQQYQKVSDDLELAKKQRADLVAENQKAVADLENALAAEQVARQQFEADWKNSVETLRTRDEELEEATTERDEAQTLARIAGEEARMRKDQSQILTKVNEELHTKLDVLSESVRDFKDELFSQERANEELASRFNQLRDELANAREFIAMNDLEMPKDFQSGGTGLTPPPRVHGVVEEARKGSQRNTEYVQISLGSDDGLAEGHNLFVYRPADSNNGRPKYLGTIQLVLLTPDKAVGTVVKKAKNGIIQAGDNVTTKF